jgi:hypothetical protein
MLGNDMHAASVVLDVADFRLRHLPNPDLAESMIAGVADQQRGPC